MRRAIVLMTTILMVSGAATAATTSMLPLSSEVDESGFGILYETLVSPFGAVTYNGTLTSRVYVDALPATQVTFVYDLQVNLSIPSLGVSEFSIAATGMEKDLRIGEILNGTHGTISGLTTNVPDAVDATNNVYPVVDELIYDWLGLNEVDAGERAVMYITTTGSVDVGQISAVIQNGGSSDVMVLAPLDDMSNPDMNVPEPATLAMIAAGCVGLLRRRRR